MGKEISDSSMVQSGEEEEGGRGEIHRRRRRSLQLEEEEEEELINGLRKVLGNVKLGSGPSAVDPDRLIPGTPSGGRGRAADVHPGPGQSESDRRGLRLHGN